MTAQPKQINPLRPRMIDDMLSRLEPSADDDVEHADAFWMAGSIPAMAVLRASVCRKAACTTVKMCNGLNINDQTGSQLLRAGIPVWPLDSESGTGAVQMQYKRP